MTLNLSAFSNVPDVRESVTPELSEEDSHLLHVWINETSNRMGGMHFISLMVFMVA